MAIYHKHQIFIEDAHKMKGRRIKCPLQIYQRAKAEPPPYLDIPPNFISIDFETNKNGEAKVFGTYDGQEFQFIEGTPEELFIAFVTKIIKRIHERDLKEWNNETNIICWTKFDLTAIERLFLHEASPEDLNWFYNTRKLQAKIEYQTQDWAFPPMIEIDVSHLFGKKATIGFSNKIDDKQLTIFFRYGGYKPTYINMINIQQLYNQNIEGACKSEGIEYSKIDQEFHIIDWKKYQTDKRTKEGVYEASYNDSYAAYKLAEKFVENFKSSFNYYPKSILSTGISAKTAMHIILGEEAYNSLNWQTQAREWNKDRKIPFSNILELELMASDSYRGGIFDIYAIGYTKEAYVADQAACYTSAMQNVPDFRGSTIKRFSGKPPKPKENEYILISGEIDIPEKADHTIFTPHPYINSLVRAYGTIIASYWYEERMHLEKQGATFKNEYGYIIKTTGKKSPIAEVSKYCLKRRQELIEQQNPGETIVKQVGNSIYGTTIEGHEIYELEGEIQEYMGFRVGRNYNPLIASYITMQPRVITSEAVLQIQANGGKVLMVNTDDVIWTGGIECFPKTFQSVIGESGYRDGKVLGYFETPKVIKDFIGVSVGRWSGYDTQKKKYVNKLRGYKIDRGKQVNILREEMEKNKNKKDCLTITFDTTEFVSTPLIASRDEYGIEDLCRIVDRQKDLNLSVMKYKKIINYRGEIIPNLLNGLIEGKPFNADYFYDWNDKTLEYRKLWNKRIEELKEMERKRTEKKKEKERKKKTKKRTDPEKWEKEKLLKYIGRWEKKLEEGGGDLAKWLIKINDAKKRIKEIEEELNGKV